MDCFGINLFIWWGATISGPEKGQTSGPFWLVCFKKDLKDGLGACW